MMSRPRSRPAPLDAGIPLRTAARFFGGRGVPADVRDFGLAAENPGWKEQWYEREMRLVGMPGDQRLEEAQDPFEKLMVASRAAISTSTAGAFNVMFGEEMENAISSNPGALASMMQDPWDRTGWRVWAAGAGSGTLGVAQGASVGTSVVPDPREIQALPKTLQLPFEATEMYAALDMEDHISLGVFLERIGVDFAKRASNDLLRDADDVTVLATALESIDRATTSGAAAAALYSAVTDANIHDINRQVDTYFNSHILHNSNVDRPFSIALVEELEERIRPFLGDRRKGDSYWLTSDNTHRVWQATEEAKKRYETVAVSFDPTLGINAAEGGDLGLHLGKWNGKLIALDDIVVQDGIGRLYQLNKAAIGMKVLKPMQSVQEDNPFVVGHNVKAVLWALEELVVRNPKKVGQIRDLAT